MNLAERMSRLGTETAFEVLEAARALEAQGRSVIHLEIGEPDFKTPPNVVKAAVDALEGGYHGYSSAAGIADLREAICEEISRTRGLDYEPEQVVVTPGGKPIIFFAILALAQAGDEVIYPNPGFPIYESMINFVGARPVAIPIREEIDFRIDLDELLARITPRTRMIILNSPANPTGGIMTAEDLQSLEEGLAGTDIMVLSDEIYSRALYEGTHFSPAQRPGLRDQTIILDGFSKTYAMTGWRLGYGLMEPQLAEQITKLMINSNSCTATAIQMAGVAALRGDQASVDTMIETFGRRRDRVVELLNEIDGLSCRTPKGAFYVFPNVSALGMSSTELQNYLLNEVGVALLSGTAFGEHGEGHIRISYAASMENLEEGIGRIREAIGKLRAGSTA